MKIYNNLPNNIKNIRNKVKFKTEKHKYLITHSFHSLTEFSEGNISTAHN